MVLTAYVDYIIQYLLQLDIWHIVVVFIVDFVGAFIQNLIDP